MKIIKTPEKVWRFEPDIEQKIKDNALFLFHYLQELMWNCCDDPKNENNMLIFKEHYWEICDFLHELGICS